MKRTTSDHGHRSRRSFTRPHLRSRIAGFSNSAPRSRSGRVKFCPGTRAGDHGRQPWFRAVQVRVSTLALVAACAGAGNHGHRCSGKNLTAYRDALYRTSMSVALAVLRLRFALVSGARGRILPERLKNEPQSRRVRSSSRRQCAIEYVVRCIETKTAIAFKLRFGEPLADGALVGELGVCASVGSRGCIANAAAHGLDVEDETVLRRSVCSLIVDLSDHPAAAITFTSRVAAGPDLIQARKVDRHAEIERNLADRVSEVLELAFWITPGVADNNEATTSANHFIKTEVFEVPAIR